MNLKKFISGVSALAIAASAFAGLAVTASAAGYTRTLSDSLEVAGYKFKAFYDFQTNTPAVLPTSGDLRYRDGNIWGLHNFGSGGRSATASIPVAESDILVIQNYTNYTSTINRGTENTALSSSTNYQVFDITTTANDVTFTTPRYSGIVAALVMEKDATIASADYTVKYVDGNGAEIQSSTTGNGVVGTTVSVDTANLVVNGQKYIYVSDNSASNAIAADGSTVVTVTYRAAATYSYTVNTNVGGLTLASGSAFEGDSVSVPYPRYINVDGTLYQKTATSNEYNYKFVPAQDNQVVTLEYTQTDITGVVYFSEGEDIAGTSVQTYSNVLIRSSNSKVGSAAGSDVTITTLQPGIYNVSGVEYINSNAGGYLNFTAGETTFRAGQVAADFDNGRAATNWKTFDQELTITEPTELKFNSDNANICLDYIYVEKTGDYVPGTVAVAGEFSGVDYEGVATALTATFDIAGKSVSKAYVIPTTDTITGETTEQAMPTTTNATVVFGIVVDGAIVGADAFTAYAK